MWTPCEMCTVHVVFVVRVMAALKCGSLWRSGSWCVGDDDDDDDDDIVWCVHLAVYFGCILCIILI